MINMAGWPVVVTSGEQMYQSRRFPREGDLAMRVLFMIHENATIFQWSHM